MHGPGRPWRTNPSWRVNSRRQKSVREGHCFHEVALEGSSSAAARATGVAGFVSVEVAFTVAAAGSLRLAFRRRAGAESEDSRRTANCADDDDEEKRLAGELRAHEFLLRVPCGTR